MLRIFTFIASFALLASPFLVYAEALSNPLGITSIAELLVRVLRLITMIAFPVLVMFLVYVGFLFVKDGGNPEGLKKAREYLMWTLVGGLLVLGGQALALGIQGTIDALSR